MNSDYRGTNLRPSNARLARLGVIVGVIMGVVGTSAGFYFGVVSPAIKSGSWQSLPPHVLWIGPALVLILVVSVCVFTWRHMRRRSQASTDTKFDW